MLDTPLHEERLRILEKTLTDAYDAALIIENFLHVAQNLRGIYTIFFEDVIAAAQKALSIITNDIDIIEADVYLLKNR